MSFVLTKKPIDLSVRGITAQVLMKILDIEEASAKDFLEGTISLHKSEVVRIAEYLNVEVEEL